MFREFVSMLRIGSNIYVLLNDSEMPTAYMLNTDFENKNPEMQFEQKTGTFYKMI